jgi:hypothetical protein
MTAVSERAFRAGRPRTHLLRRAAIGLGVALVGLTVAAGPASAATNGSDGTSNTIQFAVRAHHVVDVNAYSTGSADARLIEEDGIYPPVA